MPAKPKIVVAGDVCLDVVTAPILEHSNPSASAKEWRLTGEKRTHYLQGGAMLLEQMVKQTAPQAEVTGTLLPAPSALASAKDSKALPDEYFARVTCDEVFHSLLEVDWFPGGKGEMQTESPPLRLRRAQADSGPPASATSRLKPLPAKSSGPPALLVLDDAGKWFREDEAQWPATVSSPGQKPPWVLLKLQGSLPWGDAGHQASRANALWSTLVAKHADRLVVVLNVEDLRSAGARINAGLSWERTALDFATELQGNETFQQLRRCRWLIVRCGLDGALCWHCPSGGQARLWLVYDPAGIEGDFATSIAGGMTGYGSAFTSGLAARLVGTGLETESKGMPGPLQGGIMAGLFAARTLLRTGFVQEGEALRYPVTEIGSATKKTSKDFATIEVPLLGSTANPDKDRWTILKAVLPGGEALSEAAQQLVRTDEPTDDLKTVPLGHFGNLRTYDHDEIEAYRSLSNLIRDYFAKPKPERPLCLAVFGPPGSGKSFGVREVVKAFSQDGTAISHLTFNLSQFQSPDDLGRALQLVRDDVIAGKVPLVFFDEFDSTVGSARLYWLKFLLSPMQDGKFSDAGTDHPVGKAIFVFAGGTCHSFDQFARKIGVADKERKTTEDEFRAAKGPDFISRLRGILDIPGIEYSDAYRGAALLRRARMLRFQLSKKAPQLIALNKELRISPGVLRAFLHVQRFEHGVRSLESLIEMCPLAGCHDFNPGCLPAPDQLRLHVVPKQAETDAPELGFLDLVQHESPFPREDREKIAEAIHKHYLEERDAKKERNGLKPSHQPWGDKLEEFYKDSNRRQADDIPRKLRLMKLDWGRADQVGNRQTIETFDSDDKLKDCLEAVAQKEHDRWLAERRLAGWTFNEQENSQLKQSPAMLAWNELPDREKEKDLASIRGIPRYLKAAGYVVFAP